MANQNSRLREQLQEKEELIAALTEQLEHAAEELDRVRRTGADRGLRIGGGASSELLEQQQTLMGDLQRAVQQWEDMQAAASYGRIEVQLAELRQIVVERPVAAADDQHRTGGDSRSGDSGSSSGAGSSGAYEAFKESLSEADGSETESSVGGGAPGNSDSDITAEAAVNTAEELPSCLEPPAPVMYPESAPEELVQAIEERDEYIGDLIRRVRAAELRRGIPENWEESPWTQDELRERIEQHARSLDEHLRMAEIETSLERARLGREEMRLRMLQQQIEKEHRKLGLSRDPDSEEASPEEAAATGSRWFRMLKPGRRPDTDN